MDITIICTDKKHKIFPFLQKWKKSNSSNHNISIVNNSSQIKNGDILFLISCLEIIKIDVRRQFKHTLVIYMKVIYLVVKDGLPFNGKYLMTQIQLQSHY